MRKLTFGIALVALALLGAGAGSAQTVFTGSTQGGAYYNIQVPDGWQPADGLVIWNHGFSLTPVGSPEEVEVSPLADVLLAQGYAIAQSSYRQIGWALFKTTQDLRNLYRAFVNQVGTPEEVYLTGASLGGIVTAQAIEKGGIGNVVGAFTMCGAMAGSRNWDGALDLRLLYDLICGGVPGAAIPGGPKGLPKNSNWTPQDVAAAVNTCTGINKPKNQRTGAEKRRLKQLKKHTKLPLNVDGVLQTDMWYVTFGMGDLSNTRGKMRGKQGVGNENVDYGKQKINNGIERISPNPNAQRRLARNYTPTGRVGDVKIVSIHTEKDPLVLVENQREYAEVVPAGNLTVGVVREGTATHCGFTLAEVAGGLQSLQDWVGGGAQPTVQQLQDTCVEFEPLFGGPCRYDPGFVIPDMDGRIRPRGD